MAKTTRGNKDVKVDEAHHEHLKKIGTQKGEKSRNPKGRPAVPQEVKDALAMYSLEAVAIRYWLMMNSDNDMVRLKATDGFVKPFVADAAQEQKVDVNVSHSFGDFLSRVNKRRGVDVIEVPAVEILPEDIPSGPPAKH